MASVSEISSKLIGGATKMKPMKWLRNKYKIDAEKALALTTVSSIIIKDGVGCAMYVNQSLHNDKIPDKKRKFVAALDLTNGVLMIGAQIALFFAMRKFSEPIFNKLFRKSFNADNARFIPSRIRMQQAQSGMDKSKISRKLEIEKAYKEVRKDGLDLFKFIADIAAATIVGKRIVVPFIATPLASKVEKIMNKNEQQDSQKTDGSNNNSNPSMQGAYPKPYTVNTVRVIHPSWFETAQNKK